MTPALTLPELTSAPAPAVTCISATFAPCPQSPVPGCEIDGEPACRECWAEHCSNATEGD